MNELVSLSFFLFDSKERISRILMDTIVEENRWIFSDLFNNNNNKYGSRVFHKEDTRK